MIESRRCRCTRRVFSFDKLQGSEYRRFVEARASVDSGTERRIEEATHKLLSGRSALVVAHRLSTIQDADEILVMHQGEVRERGTHDELLSKGGLYARLYALQFEGQAEQAEAG